MTRDGRVAVQLRARRRGGAGHVGHVVLEPVRFLRRLAWLIAPPASPHVRFAGVLAGHAGWRARVVPAPMPSGAVVGDEASSCSADRRTSDAGADDVHRGVVVGLTAFAAESVVVSSSDVSFSCADRRPSGTAPCARLGFRPRRRPWLWQPTPRCQVAGPRRGRALRTRFRAHFIVAIRGPKRDAMNMGRRQCASLAMCIAAVAQNAAADAPPTEDPRAAWLAQGFFIGALATNEAEDGDGACWIADFTHAGTGAVCRQATDERSHPACLEYASRSANSVVDRRLAIELMCRDANFFRTLSERETHLGHFIALGGFEVFDVPLETGHRGPLTSLHMAGPIGRHQRTSILPNHPLRLARFSAAAYLLELREEGRVAHAVRLSDPGAGDVQVLSAVDLKLATGFASWGVVWSTYGGGSGMGEEDVWLSVLDLRSQEAEAELKWPLLIGRGQWSGSAVQGSANTTTCHLAIRQVLPGAIELVIESCKAPRVARAIEASPADRFAELRARSGRWCFREAEGWQRCAAPSK